MRRKDQTKTGTRRFGTRSARHGRLTISPARPNVASLIRDAGRLSTRHAALSTDRPILGITMGDPAGIGPEIIAKSIGLARITNVCRPIVIGSRPVMDATIRSLHLPIKTVPVAGHDLTFRRGELPVLDPLERPLGTFRPGTVSV